MDIGFIGLGNMGAHMARRLVEAGHKVVVYDTRQEAIGNLAARGAVAARSPKEVADMVETVMASLPTPDIVLKVASGPDGVIEGKRVKRFVDLSTTGAVMAERIFKALAARNIVQIDAPVSGGVRGAEKGTVAVMASGPRADVEAVEPALKMIGKFFYIGERPGVGQTMKLCNNVLSAAAMAATSESMVMGVKAGLDPRIMLDVINASSGRSTATEQKFPEVVLPRSFNQGFTASLMLNRGQDARHSDPSDRGGGGTAQTHLRRTRSRQGHHPGRATDRSPRRRRSARGQALIALRQLKVARCGQLMYRYQ
jgi:3-hydroxyisobutyrate dehydrogenase-like beta-hydroxyacid dehydrogenase